MSRMSRTKIINVTILPSSCGGVIMHPPDTFFFFKCLGSLHAFYFEKAEFSWGVSSASYHRIRNQFHLDTDHLVTQIPYFQLPYYMTSQNWAPRVSIQTRKCHAYRLQLLTAGMHSFVLTSVAFHMPPHGGT